MKKFRILLTLGITMFVIGIALIAAPHISNLIFDSSTSQTIDDYDDSIRQMYDNTDTSEMQSEIDSINEADPSTDYTVADYVSDHKISADDGRKYDWALLSLLHEQMEEYNKALLDEGQYALNDPFSFEQPSFLLSTYSIPDNVFGHISAPSINMDLPIYLGANQYNMNFGAVHLSYSSMPIGGKSTNSVFAAHRGYIGKIFFDNIVYLQEGDEVFITNPWEKRRYTVVDIQVISPYDIEKCYIQEGRDLITLLTCHPYGSNEFRYMVVCEYADASDEETDTEIQ